MATVDQQPNPAHGGRTGTPAEHYSTVVNFNDDVVGGEPDKTPTSVEVYAVGNNWYCDVRRGDKKTRPMGPYSKRQAERIQDARRRLIAKRGIARMIFE